VSKSRTVCPWRAKSKAVARPPLPEPTTVTFTFDTVSPLAALGGLTRATPRPRRARGGHPELRDPQQQPARAAPAGQEPRRDGGERLLSRPPTGGARQLGRRSSCRGRHIWPVAWSLDRRSTTCCTSPRPPRSGSTPLAAPTTDASSPLARPAWEAMRCLKRRISDAVYRQLLADARAAAHEDVGTGPGGHCGASQESSAVDLPPHIDTSDQPLPGLATPTLQPPPPSPKDHGPHDRLTTEGSRNEAALVSFATAVAETSGQCAHRRRWRALLGG